MEPLTTTLTRSTPYAGGLEEVPPAPLDLAASVTRLRTDPTFEGGALFAFLRRHQPILLGERSAIVTRYRDVVEVLERDEVFQVPYRAKIEAVTGGAGFVLGMQDSPEHEQDVANLRCAFRRDDLARVAALVDGAAAERVGAACATIDVVRDLAGLVPARVLGAYLGCPPPSEAALAGWAATAFRFVFLDPTNDPAVAAAAQAAAAELRTWLDRCIAGRERGARGDDDVLGRLLALQATGVPRLDDAQIRTHLLGLVLGGLPTTARCVAQALDVLLDRPEALAGAAAAARAGDHAALAAHVFEALRFRPNNPVLPRIAAADHVLAKGEAHEARIAKGTVVLAATQSAMFDEAIVDAPEEFRLDRPRHVYLHFGSGLHACFGRHVNEVQIPRIVGALLRRGDVRRVAGDEGRLRFEGPMPVGLRVAFA
jgi:cytochrome P450